MNIYVKENTPERLTVRLTPTSAPLVFGCGVLFLLSAPLVYWLLGFSSDLAIVGKEIKFRRAFLGKYFVTEKTIPVSEIRLIDTQVYESFASRTRDVTIHAVDDIRIPLGGLDGPGKDVVVRELNEAISLEADYGHQSGTQVWGFLLGGTLFLGGLICLYMLQTSWIIGSRLDDLLTVTISRLSLIHI